MADPKIAMRLVCLALLCVLAYASLISLPLFEDDYPILTQARTAWSAGGAFGVLHDPIFRVRATTYWAMILLWHVFGVRGAGYHLASLALHIANTWLVFAVCRKLPRIQPAAFWAAAFFAVAEGHQEAIVWFTAINELWQFFFGACALWCWLQAASGSRVRLAQAAGVAAFALALLSKESAIVWLPALVATAPWSRWQRALILLAPYLALAVLAVVSIAATRAYSFRFSDGSFSLAAPFWITWPRGISRILWIWGFVAGALLFRYRRERDLWMPAAAALAWIAVGLAPYSFLTYSTQIPSRQTYLASAGLAVLVGLATARLFREGPGGRRIAVALLALMVVHNAGYLWTKKRAQFVERARPTEQLIAFARSASGPIWVRCFPLSRFTAEEAVRLAAGREPSSLVWSADEAARVRAAEFCYVARTGQQPEGVAPACRLRDSVQAHTMSGGNVWIRASMRDRISATVAGFLSLRSWLSSGSIVRL